MYLRAAMSNPKSKALTFLIVATHSNGTKAQRWINLHDYVNFSRLAETNSFEFTLPTLTLVNEIIPMEAAIIKVQAVTVKGDTTEMNAGSFKVNPDASAEDLVTKMPGVTSSNGQVQAQGEQVKKVLVDGKPFFGDDPNAALKNLPADVVNKIQIYDGKSEQSLFSGIDDGCENHEHRDQIPVQKRTVWSGLCWLWSGNRNNKRKRYQQIQGRHYHQLIQRQSQTFIIESNQQHQRAKLLFRRLGWRHGWRQSRGKQRRRYGQNGYGRHGWSGQLFYWKPIGHYNHQGDRIELQRPMEQIHRGIGQLFFQ
jgi:hypothetical protein